MNRETRRETDGQDFVKRSRLYREFLAEKDEIARHRWLESEKQGRDIGYERALMQWVRKHRDLWRQAWLASERDSG